MRMDHLPTPGILGNAYPLMKEVVKAISQIEVAASYNGGRATEATKLAAFLTAAVTAVNAYLPVQLTNAGRALGDSITQGTGDSTLRWPTLLGTLAGITVSNNGIGGTVMQNRADAGGSPRANNGLSRYAATLLGANLVRKAYILYGLNDLRYTGAPATMNLDNFKADYETVVNGLIAAGMAPSDIVLGSPSWITTDAYSTGSAGFTGSTRVIHEQYVAAVYALAFSKGCKYAPVYEAIRDGGGASLLGADGIHLNDNGQTLVANTMFNAVLLSSGTWTAASAPPAPSPPAPAPPAPTPPAPAPSPGVAPVTVLEATTSPAMTGNSTTETYTSNPTGGIARVGSFVVGTEATFEIQHPNITDSGAVIAFDTATGIPSTTNTQDYIAQIIPSGAVYQAANSNSALVVPNFTLAAAPTARMRLRCTTTGQVYIETQNDDASTWVIRHTFATLATVGTTLHARMYCTWSTTQRRIYQPRVSGIS